jgi:hypothetical protein
MPTIRIGNGSQRNLHQMIPLVKLWNRQGIEIKVWKSLVDETSVHHADRRKGN